MFHYIKLKHFTSHFYIFTSNSEMMEIIKTQNFFFHNFVKINYKKCIIMTIFIKTIFVKSYRMKTINYKTIKRIKTIFVNSL